MLEFDVYLAAKWGDYCKRDSLKCEILFTIIKVLHAKAKINVAPYKGVYLLKSFQGQIIL